MAVRGHTDNFFTIPKKKGVGNIIKKQNNDTNNMSKCVRKFEKCLIVADGFLNGQPVCNNCLERGEREQWKNENSEDL